MPEITKTYDINSIQQLIDLNQDSKNFKLTFKCKAHAPSDEYSILVLNQSQLDTQDANQLPFKVVKGQITGDITADNDIYQNYFMVIKSDRKCKVDVTINKTEIEPKKPPIPPTYSPPPPKKKKKKKSFLQSSLFLWLVVGTIAFVLLYFIFFTKTKELDKSSVHSASVHGGSVHGGSVRSGSVHSGSVHGGSVRSIQHVSPPKRKKKFTFNDFHM